MKTVSQHIRDHLLQCVTPSKPMPSLDELRASEWSPEFENLMRNRLVMGAFRYGRIHSSGKPAWDRVESIKQRIDAYEKMGNTEYLVDIANMALLEFEEGTHPEKHFASTDDADHHTRIIPS